jgi:minor extracellular protease Epr
MPKLEALFQQCAGCKPSRHRIRQLVTLSTQASYKRCVAQLKAAGIKPFKMVNSNRMIGFHLTDIKLLRQLAAHPQVKRVEKDLIIRAHAVHDRRRSAPLLTAATLPALVTWNINRIRAPLAWNKTRGNNIRVAIIDTGIAKHPDLTIAGGVNTINGGSYADDNGHGTHVAGIVAGRGRSGKIIGTAPKVALYAVKALDQNGDGYVSDIIEGIDWCIKKRMHVINMSFGLLESESSSSLHAAIKRAYRKGIVIVASAGNSGSAYGVIDEPASYKETIAVAASSKANQIADYSSRGKGIAVTAPGSLIFSTWLKGAYKTQSGTSMAAPHVTGSAALLLAVNKAATPASVLARLQQSAVRLKGYNALQQGSGLLQLNRLLSK